jgi:DNA-damage-inducible protein D
MTIEILQKEAASILKYWSARDLQDALGYEYWQNFEKVIKKAMTAATSPEVNFKLEDHFSEVTKMVTNRNNSVSWTLHESSIY